MQSKLHCFGGKKNKDKNIQEKLFSKEEKILNKKGYDSI